MSYDKAGQYILAQQRNVRTDYKGAVYAQTKAFFAQLTGTILKYNDADCFHKSTKPIKGQLFCYCSHVSVKLLGFFSNLFVRSCCVNVRLVQSHD